MPILDLKKLYFQTLKYHSWLTTPKTDVDLVLAELLRRTVDINELNDPLAFVTLIRGCIEKRAYSALIKKDKAGGADLVTRRFRGLIQTLQDGAPSLKLEAARRIALYADGYIALKGEQHGGIWVGHIQDHFRYSSSFAAKGRLLYTTVRTLRAARCLECGTAYGMSAAFILSAQDEADGGQLVTLERDEQLSESVSSKLEQLFPKRTIFELGDVYEKLSEMKQKSELPNPDFIFHDAGHSRDDYVRDFGAICGLVKGRAVVLFDDIRWEDARFIDKPARSYQGWREIVAHPRVEMAVEIDRTLGLALIA